MFLGKNCEGKKYNALVSEGGKEMRTKYKRRRRRNEKERRERRIRIKEGEGTKVKDKKRSGRKWMNTGGLVLIKNPRISTQHNILHGFALWTDMIWNAQQSIVKLKRLHQVKKVSWSTILSNKSIKTRHPACKNCVLIYTTFEQIVLESPFCSDFEANQKSLKIYIHTNITLIRGMLRFVCSN